MLKDIHSGMLAMTALAAAALDADEDGATLDLAGYDGCELVLSVGVGGIAFSGTNKVEFILQDSDDGSTWAAVADEYILGVDDVTDGIVKTLNAAHATATAYRFGYVGYKRYLRVVADFSGTHGTATPMSAIALVRGMDNPQPAQA